MLRGEKVLLRPVAQSDLPQLWRWRTDPELWLLSEELPLLPLTYGAFEAALRDRLSSDTDAEFAIEVGGKLIGRAALFGVDATSRNARIGVTIGERSLWGRGYGRDVVAVLLDYAFAKRNLHRVALEVLASNDRARRAYAAAGFVEEGRLREHAWVDGAWVDVVVMGVLRRDWLSGSPRP